MSEMVERVRLAICARAACECDDDARICVGQAKAAIAALREPTEDMTAHLRWFGEDDLELWQLLIDRALKE